MLFGILLCLAFGFAACGFGTVPASIASYCRRRWSRLPRALLAIYGALVVPSALLLAIAVSFLWAKIFNIPANPHGGWFVLAVVLGFSALGALPVGFVVSYWWLGRAGKQSVDQEEP